MNELYEALKGFSDLPIAAVALVLGFLALKESSDKKNAILFFLISVTAVLGAAVHIFMSSVFVHHAIWIVLFPLMYEAIRLFTHLFSDYIRGEKTKEKPFFYIAEAVSCLLSYIAMIVLFNSVDMLFVVAFSAVCIVRMVYTMAVNKRLPVKAAILIFSVPFILIFQVFSEVIPYAIVYEHTIITLLMIDFYLIAKEN